MHYIYNIVDSHDKLLSLYEFDNQITLGNLYRPPRDNYSKHSIEVFLQKVCSIILTLGHKNSNTILSGDYNIKLLKITDRIKY